MTRIALLFFGLVVAGAASSAQPLGRLFFTPAERAQLDAARMQKRVPEKGTAQQPEPRPTSQTITYSGIVRRNDGKATLWLNNRAVDEKDALSGLALTGRVRPDGAVTLQVPETGASINLKVGQSAQLQTGRVVESRANAPENSAAKADAPEKSDAAAKSAAAPKADAALAAGASSQAAADKKSEGAAQVSQDGVPHNDLQQGTVRTRPDSR